MSPAHSPVCPGISRAVLCILLSSGFCSCHHYQLVDVPKTWFEAQKYCRGKYTDLAKIDSMADMQQLLAAAGSGYEGMVWIGHYDRPWEWVWSLSNSSFYRGDERKFRKWNTGEPNDLRKKEKLCVGALRGFWVDYGCNGRRPFVCYDRELPDLASVSIGRYFYINEKKTWHEAQAYCRQNHTDLASVRNDTENMMIQKVVPEGMLAAIGLYSTPWRWWSDSTHMKFTYWADGHPSSLRKNCAASVINAAYLGKWVENNCHNKLHFMCHNKKKQVFYFKLTAQKTTIDLSDPAVTEAILNVIRKKMKEKGIVKGFKLSWIKKHGKNIFHKEEKDADVV